MPLDLEFKKQVLEQIRREASPTRRQLRTKLVLHVALGSGISAILFFLVGGIHTGSRPSLLIILELLLWAAVATVSLSLARPLTAKARSRASLLGWLLAAPCLLLLGSWTLGLFFPEATHPWPGRVGYKCLCLTIAFSAAPLVACFAAAREKHPVRPALVGASVGLTGALVAGIAVNLWCPVFYLGHVIIGHVVPPLLVAMIAMGMGAILLPPRYESRSDP